MWPYISIRLLRFRVRSDYTLNKIFKFVEKNKVVIEKYSNYEISTNELIDGLKKWND